MKSHSPKKKWRPTRLSVKELVAQIVAGQDHFVWHLKINIRRRAAEIFMVEQKALQRREWRRVQRASELLLKLSRRMGEDIAVSHELARFDDHALDLSNIKPLSEIAAERVDPKSKAESEAKEHSVITHSRRIYWMAALVPYVMFRTGKGRPPWAALLKILDAPSVKKTLDHPGSINSGSRLQEWWGDSVAARKKAHALGAVSLPDSAPFDIAGEFILFNNKLRSWGRADELRYRKIVLAQMPFLKYRAQNLIRPKATKSK